MWLLNSSMLQCRTSCIDWADKNNNIQINKRKYRVYLSGMKNRVLFNYRWSRNGRMKFRYKIVIKMVKLSLVANYLEKGRGLREVLDEIFSRDKTNFITLFWNLLWYIRTTTKYGVFLGSMVESPFFMIEGSTRLE